MIIPGLKRQRTRGEKNRDGVPELGVDGAKQALLAEVGAELDGGGHGKHGRDHTRLQP